MTLSEGVSKTAESESDTGVGRQRKKKHFVDEMWDRDVAVTELTQLSTRVCDFIRARV